MAPDTTPFCSNASPRSNGSNASIDFRRGSCKDCFKGGWNTLRECLHNIRLPSTMSEIRHIKKEYWLCLGAFVSYAAERLLFPYTMKQTRPFVLLQLTLLAFVVQFAIMFFCNAQCAARFSLVVVMIALVDTLRMAFLFLPAASIDPVATVLLLQVSAPILVAQNLDRAEPNHLASAGTILLGLIILIYMGNVPIAMIAYSMSALPQYFGSLAKQWWLMTSCETYVAFNLMCLLYQSVWSSIMPLWGQWSQAWTSAEVLTVIAWLIAQVASSHCIAQTIATLGATATARVVCAATILSTIVLMPCDATIVPATLVLLGMLLFHMRPL